MKKYICVFIVFVTVIIANFSAFGQYNVPSRKRPEIKEQKVFVPDYEFLFSFSYHTSSGFFNNDGELVTDLPDTTTFPDIPLRYTFDLRRYTFDFDFKYYATKKLTLTAKAPVTIYTLDEIFIEYIDPETGRYPRGLRRDLTHTRVDFIGLSASYALLDGKYINRFFAEVRIPTGTHDGVRNDPLELWSDGAFEFIPGVIFGTSSDKGTIELGAKYNYRGEDMTNRVIGNLNLALHTVPGTRFYGFFEGALNVSDDTDNLTENVFDVTKMPWRDEFLDVGFGFKFVIEDHYIGDFNYRIRLAGRNTFNHAAYFINFGIRF